MTTSLRMRVSTKGSQGGGGAWQNRRQSRKLKILLLEPSFEFSQNNIIPPKITRHMIKGVLRAVFLLVQFNAYYRTSNNVKLNAASYPSHM